ncbi:cell cycle checkpoint protein RAD17-like isoform X1 [Epargyreus clarus]|uniref:cell cycle checkpoint protein RAD17-like isoform X1 n=1 Tax=Epargyreus clarus TaxID=520877 RepID=UPI003C2D5A30
MPKGKKWFTPEFNFDEGQPPIKNTIKAKGESPVKTSNEESPIIAYKSTDLQNVINNTNWMKNFDPEKVEDLAVNNKKVQEVEEWMKVACKCSSSSMLLLTGPVGCGKTATVRTLATKHNIRITEWITPVDIEFPSEYGDFEFKEKQSKQFLDFILNAANFTSLLDNNDCKLVLVEDFPNTFLRNPSEFTDVLQQYKQRAKSPIVFISSETHTDNKNSVINLFTPALKETFKIQQIMFNSVSATGLKLALKRASDIISKKYTSMYNVPTNDLIESVVNSSGGDVRSAILNLHFACLKGSNANLETSIFKEKEVKSKTTRKKKNPSSKFLSLGKDQTVSILHGVGRVLNPKIIADGNGSQQFSHLPKDIIEQFLSHPSSFVNFLEENYLPHFSCPNDTVMAAMALSDADVMLAEWNEKLSQEQGLYVAVAGLMLANKHPISAWNPVRGPKNMKIQYPSLNELPLLEQNYLYKGKVLVTDYLSYYKIITS